MQLSNPIWFAMLGKRVKLFYAMKFNVDQRLIKVYFLQSKINFQNFLATYKSAYLLYTYIFRF